jgi:hypothetical protein
MKARLDMKVESLRGQKMTFQNEGGLELTLSVPDTTDVKDTFSTLVTTIVLQQEQIVLLQTTMKQMAADNANAQAKMIAWTNQCVTELKNQNESLQDKLTESNLQIENMVYNMQGFVDGSKTDIKTSTSSVKRDILLNIQTPAVIRTRIPIVTLDPNDDTNGSIKLFYTEGGEAGDDGKVLAEGAEAGAGAGGGEAAESSATTTDGPPPATATAAEHPPDNSSAPASTAIALVAPTSAPTKNKKPSVGAKMYYQSIRKNRLPLSPSGRWRWAIRKVLRGVRIKAMRVGYTRNRVEKGNSMVERLERLETDMFTVPLQLRSFVQGEAERVTAQAKSDLDKLAAEVGAQHHETRELCDSLSARITDVSSTCADLDGRLLHMGAMMEENSKKQGQEVDEKLASLGRRLVDVEGSEGARLRSRAVGLQELVQTLRTSAEEANARLTAAVAQAQSVTQEGEEANPGDQLSALLELDTNLRETRRSLGGLQELVFNAAESIKSFRQDITCCQFAAAEGTGQPPSPRVFSSESAKQDMLQGCTDLEKSAQGLFGLLADANSYWKRHDASLGQRWETLSSVIKASQAVALLSSSLESLMAEVKSRPSEDAVRSISLEAAASAVGSAIGPVRTEVRNVGEQLHTLRDQVGSVETTQKGFNEAVTGHSTAIGAMQAASGELKVAVDEMAETMSQLQNRPMAVAPAAAPVSDSLVTFTRGELEGPPVSDDQADGVEAGGTIATGAHVTVIEGSYAGREGVVVSLLNGAEDESGQKAPTKYQVRLNPLQVTIHRQASKRPAASALSDETLNTLRLALASIELKMANMHRDKIDAQSAVKLIRDHAPEDKGRMLEEMEESVKAVSRGLEDLRRSQNTELGQVKQELKDSLSGMVAAGTTHEEPQTTIMTGQCLGCGRAASMHGNSCLMGSYLGQQRPDSPNVLRGGFRLPVSVRPRSALLSSGSHASHASTLPGGSQTLPSTYVAGQSGNPEFTTTHHLSAIESSASLNLAEDDRYPDPDASQIVGDPYIPKYTSTRPKTASGAFSASQRTSGRGAAAAGLKDMGTGVVVKAVRQLNGNDVNAHLRPIRRAGFAGKKSMRAEVSYAPERYDITVPDYTTPYYDAGHNG